MAGINDHNYYEAVDTVDDFQLCMAARNGDSVAENTLVRRYAWLVRAESRPFFLSGGDGEDLIQEGMLGLLSAIRDWDPAKSNFKSFTSLCVKRSIISAVRASLGKKHDLLNSSLSFDQLDEGGGDIIPTQAQDPEALVIGNDEAKRRRDAISAKLSGFERHVLNLYLGGASYLEMANELGCSVKSVDNAVQRIRRKTAYTRFDA